MHRSPRQLRRDAIAIFRAALEAANATNAVGRHFAVRRNVLKAGTLRMPLQDFDRIFLIAAGKAAVDMAITIQSVLSRPIAGGVVVTSYGSGKLQGHQIHLIEAGHPIPDVAGLKASKQVIRLLRELNARDLLLLAVSGGASALLVSPAEPITLHEKQKTTDLLLRAGADIFELNAIRKHISTLKGGQLAALAYPATIVTLLLSDVIGDPPDVIGSGPAAPDPSTFADAIRVLEKYNLLDRVPRSVRARLEAGVRGETAETPKPSDPIFKNVHTVVIGSNRLALRAAARTARVLGYRPLILSSSMQGEAREVAQVHAQVLGEVIASGHPVPPPCCILSGGETTVTVRGSGKGGRNQEFALAAATAINGLPNALVLSAGTDGADGATDAAGAIATGETSKRARRAGLDAADYLARNDSYAFFHALGDLVKTGRTGTNVMDIYLLLAG